MFQNFMEMLVTIDTCACCRGVCSQPTSNRVQNAKTTNASLAQSKVPNGNHHGPLEA